MITPPSVDLLRVAYFRLQNKESGRGSLFLRRRFQSPLYQLPSLVWNQLGSGFFCFTFFFFFLIFPAPNITRFITVNLKASWRQCFSILERHFLPVPAPRDGWTHSNFRFPSLACAVPVLGFFSFFFCFLLSATLPWEHRLTLYPWPDSLAKNSSHSATRVQSHWRHAAAGKQGGQITRVHKTKHIKGAWRILHVRLLLGLQNKGKRLAQVFSEPR